jgi:hypothetical protein
MTGSVLHPLAKCAHTLTTAPSFINQLANTALRVGTRFSCSHDTTPPMQLNLRGIRACHTSSPFSAIDQL